MPRVYLETACLDTSEITWKSSIDQDEILEASSEIRGLSGKIYFNEY